LRRSASSIVARALGGERVELFVVPGGVGEGGVAGEEQGEGLVLGRLHAPIADIELPLHPDIGEIGVVRDGCTSMSKPAALAISLIAMPTCERIAGGSSRSSGS